MKLSELLSLRGLKPREKVKLARHRERQFDIEVIVSRGHFEDYQSWQSRAVFDKCDLVASFLGEEGRLARLLGVYHVRGRAPRGSAQMPQDFPFPSMAISNCYVYQLERDPRFDDLAGRVVIDWGASARAWVQTLRGDRDKAVFELRPSGSLRPFPGYLDLELSFDELCRVVENPSTNREWHRALASVGGVYLILDTRTGAQYIGSASGGEGILARWRSYVRCGHGGNQQLRDLLLKDPSHKHDWRFALLQVLDRSTSQMEAVQRERVFKRKLGTRAFGLNDN